MRILIGVADDATSQDAVAFAATLARTYSATVSVVMVSADSPEYINDHLDPRATSNPTDEAARLVEGFAASLQQDHGLRAQAVVHHHRSIGVGLSEIAEGMGADLVVVGSGPGGSLGRFSMGSTSNQLLHHIGVPLVLVPAGYARHPLERLRRIMVAFAEGPEGQLALERGADLARDAGIPMDVMTILVRHRMFGSDLGADAEGGVLTGSLEMLKGYQTQALTSIDTQGLQVSTDVLVGDSPAEAMNREDWEPGDLLVVASASGGLLRRVFLGDMTFKILRASTVPTMVLPRHHD